MSGSKTKGDDRLQNLTAHILQEAIRADMSMHEAQLKAWQWFAEHRPQGEYINSDIHEGFASQLYLALNDLKINFSVRPLSRGILSRLHVAWKILTSRKKGTLDDALAYEICSPNEPDAIALQISVTRFKDGTVKAEYTPADQITADLLC
jgi:hypothetical protein